MRACLVRAGSRSEAGGPLALGIGDDGATFEGGETRPATWRDAIDREEPASEPQP